MVDLAETVRSRLSDVLAPDTVSDAAQLVSDSPRQQNPRLAAALLGRPLSEVDRSSREYRNAIRNVQRWRRGETTPRAGMVQRLVAGVRRQLTPDERRRAIRRRIGDTGAGVGVQVSGTVRISQDVRRRQLPIGDRRQTVSSDALTPMVNAAAIGEWREAAAALEIAFFDAYGVDPHEGEIQDVEQLTIEPE